MSTNERTIIRTIVKWSKSAVILAVATVLLVAFVFVKTVHADSIKKEESYQIQLSKSQQETSKTKAQLEITETEKAKLAKEVQLREEKITQLEQENASLK